VPFSNQWSSSVAVQFCNQYRQFLEQRAISD